MGEFISLKSFNDIFGSVLVLENNSKGFLETK